MQLHIMEDFTLRKTILNPLNGKLLREGKWRNFEIKSTYQDLPLIVKDKNDNSSFMDQGDSGISFRFREPLSRIKEIITKCTQFVPEK